MKLRFLEYWWELRRLTLCKFGVHDWVEWHLTENGDCVEWVCGICLDSKEAI